MPQVDVSKMEARLSALRMSPFTLAALADSSESELEELVADKLDEERVDELMRALEEALRLDAGALVLECPIPDAAARKATAKKLRAARKAMGSALESCRTGRGTGFCETLHQQLASLDQLDEELTGESKGAYNNDDEG
jgi:hypothetical protein